MSRAWIGRTGVRVGGFVGLSTMLNNISKVQSVSDTGSWSSCGSVFFDILRWVAGLAKKGSGTRMGWIFNFIPPCRWNYGVIDQAKQHIQRWEDGYHDIMMNIDLVVKIIVVE